MTKQQKDTIKTLVRRANRRIERATLGQRGALEYYVEQVTGGKKFSAATKGLTAAQADLKIKQLEKFLASKVSTRKGWDKVKADNIRKANETLHQQGYDLTDEELSEILKQLDVKNGKEYYRAINLVSAAKAEDEDWTGSPDQISEAIAEKASAQQALEKALRNRERFIKKNAAARAKQLHKERTKK